MKKEVLFVWDEVCQQAFENIKDYLTKPLVLKAPVSRKPFLIYVQVMDHALGTLLAQHNEQSQERAIYYLSRTMISA